MLIGLKLYPELGHFPTDLRATVLCDVAATALVHTCYFVCDKHRRIRLLLRHRLIESGVPICVSCGYLLTGLTKMRCPESATICIIT